MKKSSGVPPCASYRKLNKLLLTMKLLSALMLCSTLQLSANIYSQSTNFSLMYNNVKVKDVFKAIEEQSDYRFFYNDDLSAVSKVVNIKTQSKKIDAVLSELLENSNLSYKIMENNLIVIAPKDVLQQKKVTGTITDATTDEPLIGVNVVIEGTTVGVVTDVNGKFSIDVSNNPSAVLEISYIGYTNEKVNVNGQSALNVKLIPDIKSLDEVVVVGFGTQKKKDITGSVAVVSQEAFDSRPNTQFTSAIQGKAAGVQVISGSGKPSDGVSIRIRGVNSISAGSDPLYVVDGVPTSDIKYLNPSDIESISVLKDASSAAIYGASGSNGVVLVTTKKGKAGETKVNFDMYTGFSTVWKKMDVLNGEQYQSLMTEMGYVTDWTKYNANTNWQDEVFRRGTSQNYQLSFSGDNGKTGYYISGGWTQQNGAIRSSTMDRYNFKVNMSQKVSSWLTLGTNLTFTRWHDVDVTDNQSVAKGGVVLGAVTTPPVMTIFNKDGSYTSNPFQDWENPVSSTDAAKRGYVNQRLLGNVYGEAQLIEDLKFKTSFGVDYVNGKYDYFLDPYKTSYGRAKNGIGKTSSDLSNYWISENTLTYTKKVDDHDLNVVAGAIAQDKKWESTYVEKTGYSSANIPTVNAGSTLVSATGTMSEKRNASFISRVAYSYGERYLMTANFRADASSSFGPSNRWGYFPSFSLGWRISKENFFESLSAINDLKLRAGWGQVGNDQINTYAWVGAVSSGANYPIGGVILPGTYPSSIENKKLKWEKTVQSNVGLDLAVLNSRITFSFDAYVKNTSDMLLYKSLPYATGFESSLQNIGELQNKGVEFQLTTHNFTGDFKWTTDLNLSINRNKVVNTNGQDIIGSDVASRGNLSFSKEGEPLGLFYGYVAQGVDPKTGMMIYKDFNNDGKIDADHDRTIIGNPNPDFTYGITNEFEWKNITLNIFLQGSQGNDIFNASRIETEGLYYPTNQTTEVLRRWTTPGQVTDIPKATPNDNFNTKLSTRFVEDGSYLRLKSLTLGYILPKSFVSKLHIGSAKIYLTGENLLTFTKYNGFDPEVNAFGNSNINLGVDYGTYPQTRNIIFGLNLSF